MRVILILIVIDLIIVKNYSYFLAYLQMKSVNRHLHLFLKLYRFLVFITLALLISNNVSNSNVSSFIALINLFHTSDYLLLILVHSFSSYSLLPLPFALCDIHTHTITHTCTNIHKRTHHSYIKSCYASTVGGLGSLNHVALCVCVCTFLSSL